MTWAAARCQRSPAGPGAEGAGGSLLQGTSAPGRQLRGRLSCPLGLGWRRRSGTVLMMNSQRHGLAFHSILRGKKNWLALAVTFSLPYEQ